MSIFKCKVCGEDLFAASNETVVTCEYCGTQQTLSSLGDEKLEDGYDYSDSSYHNDDYQKDEEPYSQSLSELSTGPEVINNCILVTYMDGHEEEFDELNSIEENREEIISIVIPDSVTSIGEDAFYGCSSLTSITIPDTVTRIGDSAFYECSSLQSIKIPDSVTSIGEDAFFDCSSLQSITIPDSVMSIGSGAFSCCESLQRIVLPSVLISIESEVFSGCKSLRDVNISDFVISFGEGAFGGCEFLDEFIIKNDKYSVIDNCLIEAKTGILISGNSKSIIPDTVTRIGESAFNCCESLQSIVIPDSVTSIGRGAFNWCKSLQSIVIPDSVTSIGAWAFNCCESLQSIVIPDSVTSIGENAFRCCESLQSIVIPNPDVITGDDVFDGCELLDDDMSPGIIYSQNKEKKKKIKLVKIVSPITAVLIVFVILLITVIIPYSKYGADYKNAVILMEEKKYSEAIAAFEAMDGYKDSAVKINECNTAIKDEKYNEAVKLMEEKKYPEAIAAFEAMEGYKDSSKNKVECEIAAIKNCKVNDTVLFGAYEQDNNTSNGKEDIEWLVLAKEENRVLVISKYALDCKQYNTSYSSVTWETCSFRKWLNNDFINSAFSEEEKSKIPTVAVSADKNPEYSTNPGNATQDKVFLLSITEAEKYFTTDEARKCVPTAYAKAQGAYASSSETLKGKATCWWWLRSPGVYQDTAARVYSDGSVFYLGNYVNGDGDAVRPALWIELK